MSEHVLTYIHEMTVIYKIIKFVYIIITITSLVDQTVVGCHNRSMSCAVDDVVAGNDLLVEDDGGLSSNMADSQ